MCQFAHAEIYAVYKPWILFKIYVYRLFQASTLYLVNKQHENSDLPWLHNASNQQVKTQRRT